jgi:O-antigen ligase
MPTTASSLFGLSLLGALALFSAVRPRLALLCFLFCVPVPSLPEWLGFDPRLYWAFFLGARAVYEGLVRGDVRMPKHAIAAWLGFVGVAALVLRVNHYGIGGEDLESAYSFFRYFIGGSLIFFSFRQFVTTREEMRPFILLFAASVLCVSAEGLFEAGSSYAAGGGGRIEGVFGNPNYLAGFLALSVSILQLLRPFLHADQVRSRRFLRIAIVCAALCCVATFSRGGITALVLAASLNWFLREGSKVTVKRVVLALLPVAITVTALTTAQLMTVRFHVSYSADPGTTDIAALNQSFEDLTRLEAALYAIDLFAQHPVFGSGIGTFAATNYQNTGNYVANHDTYLEILTGTGVVGLLLIFRVLWVLVAALDGAQRRALAPVLGVVLAVGATTDLFQALEFFAVLALAYCFSTVCLATHVVHQEVTS